MGFHYYAHPIALADQPNAPVTPAQIACDPAPRSSSPQSALDLGRCWRCLQVVLGLDTSRERPSADLVRTPPPHTGLSRGTYARTLTPHEVAVIAEDLDTLLRGSTGSDLGACLFQFPADSVRPHLKKALEFTRNLTAEGQGLTYVVGEAGSRAVSG